ncbi:Heparinase II/III-like protein [Planctomycetes bacterium CA13]|uniref:Heparinase II/III-like protein n=2 Tax=Novipirellula herctigrandis TaxID=2527986 RepID=A0A5C5Z9V5_9BACT|nr:Heparinase II/III-like protein [Planctomycetes bacterium CA13]
MKAALDINAFDKPYFSRIGYYPMYLMPPGKEGGGFGDLTAKQTSSRHSQLMSVLASQSRNQYWQWYVDQHGGSKLTPGYVGFLRGSLTPVTPKPPTDLPTSRLFRGVGQAYLNTNILDAKDDVQVVFKSSPFGTQSHGYEANNSFLLYAYGERLLIRSGYRDIYGSEHHRRWMWSTRSVNNITLNHAGKNDIGQLAHSSASQGQIVDMQTSPAIDVVVGEAGSAYRTSPNPQDESRSLDRFTRAIVFIKPDLVVVYDCLKARQPTEFTYWLHAKNEFRMGENQQLKLAVGDVECEIEFLSPQNLTFSQTDQYDPNPRDRIKLREWHLSAVTPSSSGTFPNSTQFVTLYRPHRKQDSFATRAKCERMENGGMRIEADINNGHIEIQLPKPSRTVGDASGESNKETIVVHRYNQNEERIQTIKANLSTM